MNNKVIYTSLVGNYDSLNEPEYIMPGWDYICFSNDWVPQANSVWEVRPIPIILKNKLRLSRFAKLNPHIVLPEYEYSLWIDSNITIVDNTIEARLNYLIENEITISIPKHQFRNCIYKEAEVCIKEGRDQKKVIKKQVDFLRKNGFPENLGLYENNMIFRKHNSDKIKALDNEWWRLYMAFSKRDQLSLVYIIWSQNINCNEFLSNGEFIRNFKGLQYVNHNLGIFQKCKQTLLRFRNKCLTII